jgi:uncharacterized membrane protein
MEYLLLFLCALLWGSSTFFNRLSVETTSPMLMRVIVGVVYLFYIPIALRLSGISNPFNHKWSLPSIILTVLATFISLAANIIFYKVMKGSAHSGAYSMMICLSPVVTLILSMTFLNEQLTLPKSIGIGIMFVGAVILAIFR